MAKKLKEMPKFKSEDAEREFWATADSTEYVDWSKAKRARFPKIKQTPIQEIAKFLKHHLGAN
jgi:hypothetical protein